MTGVQTCALPISSRRPIRPATVAVALRELEAAALAAVDVDDQDELTGRWAALPVARDPLLDAVDLHGAHDFRHTYATWLEDAGIPARVIDELMGHEASGRGQQRGSAMGAHYRHTTPEMAARVVEAVQQRLAIVLEVAEIVADLIAAFEAGDRKSTRLNSSHTATSRMPSSA